MTCKGMSKVDAIEKIGLVLAVLTLCFIGVKSLAVSLTGVFSFDGAMNAQVARNLNRGLGYASSYPSHILFDGKIQTGPTVLLPVALAFKILGESFFSGLLVNALYLFLTAVGLFYFLRRHLGLASVYIFLTLLAFALTPALFSYGAGLYGEIPALCFLIFSVIFIYKFFETRLSRYALYSGLALGFSVLTKTVLLISLPSVLLVFFTSLLDNIKSVGNFINKVISWLWALAKPLFLFTTGFLAPIASFEIHKISLMGAPKYLSWWKAQIVEILGQAGVAERYSDTEGVYDKLLYHLKLFHSYTGIPPFILILLLSFIGIGFLGALFFYREHVDPSPNRKPIIRTAAIIISIVLSYFVWWLLITPSQKAWYRRILNGTILLEVSVAIISVLLTKILSRSTLRFRDSNSLGILFSHLPFFFMVTCFLFYGSYDNLIISFNNTPEKISVYKIANLIKSLPQDSKFYGMGWWQAPLISFAADKNFIDLTRDPDILIPGEKKNSFLVADFYTLAFASEELNNTLYQFVYSVKYQDEYGALFELKERNLFNYQPFTSDERIQSLPSRIDFTQYSFSNPMRNVFFQERNPKGKWAQNISAYLLGYREQKFLSIRFVIPDLSKYAKDTLGVTIFVNREKVHQQSFNVSGPHEIIVPLKQDRLSILEDTIEVTIVCDNTIAAGGDTRQLSLFLTEISLRD